MNQPLPSPPPPATEPPAPPPPARPLRDLAWAAGFLALLFGLSVAGYHALLTWKAGVDTGSEVRYEQPTWSSQGSHLAYLRVETPTVAGRGTIRSQLWASGRFGDHRQLLAELPPGRFRILGWLLDDTRVILQPLEESAEGPRFLDVATDGSGGRWVRFSDARMRVVGNGQREIFLERPHRNADGRVSGVELVQWRPDSTGFSPLVTIPSRAAEQVRIESVAAAPDGQRLALVLRAPAQGGPMGVWIFHRSRRTLTWTTISAAEARDLRLDWSGDSRSLVGAAWLGESSELYLVRDDPDPIPTRMRTSSGPLAFRPVWPRDGNRVLLLEDQRILEFDFQTHRARVLLAPERLGLFPEELALSPLGSLATFRAREGPVEDLYVLDLHGGRPEPLGHGAAELKARRTLLYEIASGLEFAVAHWSGREPPASR